MRVKILDKHKVPESTGLEGLDVKPDKIIPGGLLGKYLDSDGVSLEDDSEEEKETNLPDLLQGRSKSDIYKDVINAVAKDLKGDIMDKEKDGEGDGDSDQNNDDGSGEGDGVPPESEEGEPTPPENDDENPIVEESEVTDAEENSDSDVPPENDEVSSDETPPEEEGSGDDPIVPESDEETPPVEGGEDDLPPHPEEDGDVPADDIDVDPLPEDGETDTDDIPTEGDNPNPDEEGGEDVPPTEEETPPVEEEGGDEVPEEDELTDDVSVDPESEEGSSDDIPTDDPVVPDEEGSDDTPPEEGTPDEKPLAEGSVLGEVFKDKDKETIYKDIVNTVADALKTDIMAEKDPEEDPEGVNFKINYEGREAVLSNESRIEIENNISVLKDRLLDIDMALEAINDNDGVSRSMVASFEHILPEECPINSFTKLPTHTNIAIARASLEDARSTVIGAIIGIIISVVGFLISKLFGKEKVDYVKVDKSAKTKVKEVVDTVKGSPKVEEELEGMLRNNRHYNALTEEILFNSKEMVAPILHANAGFMYLLGEVDRLCNDRVVRLIFSNGSSDMGEPEKVLIPDDENIDARINTLEDKCKDLVKSLKGKMTLTSNGYANQLKELVQLYSNHFNELSTSEMSHDHNVRDILSAGVSGKHGLMTILNADLLLNHLSKDSERKLSSINETLTKIQNSWLRYDSGDWRHIAKAHNQCRHLIEVLKNVMITYAKYCDIKNKLIKAESKYNVFFNKIGDTIKS